MRYTLERVIRGQDTIAATGNILRDYLTDLFPILELGTSAKMLSIVPLMAGGGHVRDRRRRLGAQARHQLVEENHLRWDSLGEFLALGASLEDLGDKTGNKRGQGAGARRWTPRSASCWRTTRVRRARPASSTTAAASSTSRCTGRRQLAEQTEDKELAEHFARWPRRWPRTKTRSSSELAEVQGEPVDIGGYYYPDAEKTTAVMRPSKTFNADAARLARSAGRLASAPGARARRRSRRSGR